MRFSGGRLPLRSQWAAFTLIQVCMTLVGADLSDDEGN